MMQAIIIIWTVTIVLASVLWWRAPERLAQAIRNTRVTALMLFPRIPFAILGAGFIAAVLPREVVAGWLGGASGWVGILTASLIGSFVPSGPMVSFPVAIALVKAGAGTPQIIAFLTAWAVIAVHRLIVWDLPTLGVPFTRMRILASLTLPPLAGFTAAAVLGLLAL